MPPWFGHEVAPYVEAPFIKPIMSESRVMGLGRRCRTPPDLAFAVVIVDGVVRPSRFASWGDAFIGARLSSWLLRCAADSTRDEASNCQRNSAFLLERFSVGANGGSPVLRKQNYGANCADDSCHQLPKAPYQANC